MSLRRTTPSLALSAAAVLMLSSVSLVLGASSATAAVPAGTTLVVTAPSGASTPGRAQTVTVLVTAPDGSDAGSERDPLQGEDVTLTVDRGFLTTGETQPSVVGEQAGNLVDEGTADEVTTNSVGVATFQVGIERDAGFDDDGRVATALTASAEAVAGGAVTGQGTAQWSSADPLNGGSVEIVLSPQDRQEGPVAPAATGDRTYFDVITRDQFGNPVSGETVDLNFDDYPPQDFDYELTSVLTDLNRLGDFWVEGYVPGSFPIVGDWLAPVYRYTDTAGTAATRPDEDVRGSTTASYYDIAFGASSFTVSSSAVGDVAVGTTVTQTLTVLDQRGNPVEGYEVDFFRFGPDGGGDEGRASRITNNRGQARYTFVGSGAGTAKVTAVVSDGVSSRTVASEVRFRIPIGASLAGLKDGKGAVKVKAKGKAAAKATSLDGLKVSASKAAAGARVAVYQVTGKGKLKRVRAQGAKLDGAGKVTLRVRDRNGRKATRYVVTVLQTETTFAATSGVAKVR